MHRDGLNRLARRLSGGVALATLLAGPAAATLITSFSPGDLVVSVEGDGGNTGTYVDNQAAPLNLYEFSITGTTAATNVGTFALPSTISGEYGSSSEGSIQLTGNGKALTMMGYGVNANAYNAAFDPNGAGTALAQSCSLSTVTLCAHPVSRVVAVIGAGGTVNTSTQLYNVFNENNPRSVYSPDGKTFYVSGQGNSPDQTGGVFITTLGSHSATAITGNDTTGNTATQDTRFVTEYNGTLYVSVDSKEGSGSNRDFIGTLGTPPATGLYQAGAGPTRLAGYGNNGGTGKVTLTAGQVNGINKAGEEINLSPENFFFANPDTLYVADSGSPKNDSVTNDPNKDNPSTLGDGGLQKWSLVNGQWQLDYTLSTGLNLVANTAASGTTGLEGLTGEVVGNDVELFATNYTIGDTDQTFLFGITDILGDMTLPTDEMFTTLATAPADSNFKGVSFTPSPAPEPSSLAAMLAGLLSLGVLRWRRRG